MLIVVDERVDVLAELVVLVLTVVAELDDDTVAVVMLVALDVVVLVLNDT